MRAVLAGIAIVSALAVPLQADEVEAEARAIEAMLVAPCCWSQQVSLHQSEAAAEIKRDVRIALKAGQTRQQIIDEYVRRYGTQILVEPPARGFAAWLYVLPVVTLVLSAGGLAFVVKRFAARGGTADAAAPADAPSNGDSALADKLDDELRELD